MGQVTVRREKVVIPTYETAAYDKNPMFLEHRVYQGSSGRVFPTRRAPVSTTVRRMSF